MKTNLDYHIPVLLNESIEALNINPNGIYVDVTFGGGGHSMAILEKLDKGKLYAFDQDKDALKNKLQSENFELIHANFRHIQKFLKAKKITKVDGILADLGVSSYQINEPEKGFSYRGNAELDMRMNTSQKLSALEVVNEYDAEELSSIFKKYGDIKNAWKLANLIRDKRTSKKITSTNELVEAVQAVTPKHNSFKYLSKVFQAIRIEVNQEIQVLEEFLDQCSDLIKKDGRLAIIAYHSLEDRLSKNYLRYGNYNLKEYVKDFYGNITRPFSPITSKAITPSEFELEKNPRSRSAKLRGGIRL